MGVRTKSIFWSGEHRIDEDTFALYTQKNDRKYYRKSTQKDSVSEDPKKPIKQRTPGIMAHITVCSANGGVLLKPHSPPKEPSDDGSVLM